MEQCLGCVWSSCLLRRPPSARTGRMVQRAFGDRSVPGWQQCGRRRVTRAQATSPFASSSADGSSASEFDVSTKEFPRRSIRDPYRRLGISREASAEEVSEARTVLVGEYALDEKGVESIERAHDKILRDKLSQRRKARGLRRSRRSSRRKDDPPVPGSGILSKVQSITEVPERTTLIRRAFLYSFLVMWSLYQSASSGPAFQVLIGFATCVWLLADKRKNQGTRSEGWWWPGKSFWQSGFALLSGFVAGSVIPVLFPVIFPRGITPEFITAQFIFASLFACATFLK